VIVWTKTYERFRKAVITGRLLRITGPLQREGVVVHLIAEQIEDLSPRLTLLAHPADDAIERPLRDAALRAESAGPLVSRARHPREQAKKLFPSRDFH